MKKILLLFFLNVFVLAGYIKDDVVSVSANFGLVKIHDSNSAESIGVGYYFYDPNIYEINNKVSLEIERVNSDADFYITSLKLDWIKNNHLFSPFLGINVAYFSFNDNNYDYSTNAWGGEMGVIFNVTNNMSVNAEFTYQKAIEKKEVWNSPLKKFRVGLEFTF